MLINLVYPSKCLEYKEEGHPDTPDRIVAISDFLKKKGVNRFIEPKECSEEDLLLVHSQELVEKVKNNCLPYDPNTPNIKDIYKYASLSCGAAISACRMALDGQLAFALSRPPGHHASRRYAGGFCYFNNISVAIEKLVLTQGLRAAILDIDGHHANGTEAIFRGRKNIICVSLHQFPAFPGTGSSSFDNCYNYPIYEGSTTETYLDKFRNALDIIKCFNPDILGISVGFDSHFCDPLLQLPLKDKDFYLIGKEISTIRKKKFIVLEGGYNISTIGNTSYCFLNGLTSYKSSQDEDGY